MNVTLRALGNPVIHTARFCGRAAGSPYVPAITTPLTQAPEREYQPYRPPSQPSAGKWPALATAAEELPGSARMEVRDRMTGVLKREEEARLPQRSRQDIFSLCFTAPSASG